MVSKKKVKKYNYDGLLNEAPTVVGSMSAIIGSGGSIDTAVRDVSENGPRCARHLFSQIVYDCDSRIVPDLKEGLTIALNSLPEKCGPFRRSVQMLITASESSDRTEKARMISEASNIALTGLKESGEQYGSSLNTPCMAIFTVGIMIPMILMSILPMLNIGGLFGSSPLNTSSVAAITLVVIPAFILVMALSIKGKNPFIDETKKPETMDIVPLLSAVPLYMILSGMMDNTRALAFSVTIAGLITVAFLGKGMTVGKKVSKQISALGDSLFELGNRLVSGENFDSALIGALEARKDVRILSENYRREVVLCRGDMVSAIEKTFLDISPAITDILKEIQRCSERDLGDAGRLAVSLARQHNDQESVRKTIRNKMKSMTDMMSGTAMLFAPMVLGLSTAMLGPVSNVIDGIDSSMTLSILTVYLIELTVLISVLIGYLDGNAEPKKMIYRIGMMMPISMIVFMVCSGIQI